MKKKFLKFFALLLAISSICVLARCQSSNKYTNERMPKNNVLFFCTGTIG